MTNAQFCLEDFSEGQQYSLEITITESMVNAFAHLSGDFSSIHMDSKFALSRGFTGRVVHGVLLTSFISQLVGVHFPGDNALLLSLSTKFLKPAYIGDHICIIAIVDQISASTGTMVLKVRIIKKDDESTIATSSVAVGFTQDR